MKILNLTQHDATEEQVAEGVFEVSEKKFLRECLTFNDLPEAKDIHDRAMHIAMIAKRYDIEYAMIGGAPYLMSTLEKELKLIGVKPVYSFSERITEEKEKDGEVIKQSRFRHKGFVVCK